MPALVNLCGAKFGRWTVEQRAEWPTAIGGARWHCTCECGNRAVVRGQTLRTGESRSCGCLNVDVHRAMCVTRNKTHGMAKSPTYNVWCGVVARCTNPKARGWRAYGGKGVTVCQRWRDSFEAFYADMGERPRGSTIDRIDNAKGYEPGNCRWATMRGQQNNRTNNTLLTHDGRSMTLMEWSRETGLERTTIAGRLKLGWSLADALTKPPDPTAGRFQLGDDARNGIRHPR